jgi:hypothetical protein
MRGKQNRLMMEKGLSQAHFATSRAEAFELPFLNQKIV